MGITKDSDIDPAGAVALKHIAAAPAVSASLTDAVVFNVKPGYAFEVIAVSSFCRTKAGAAAFKVKVGGREAVPAGVFTAATGVAQELSDTLADLRGTATEAITIEYTTDGDAVVTHPHIGITVRPLGLRRTA